MEYTLNTINSECEEDNSSPPTFISNSPCLSAAEFKNVDSCIIDDEENGISNFTDQQRLYHEYINEQKYSKTQENCKSNTSISSLKQQKPKKISKKSNNYIKQLEVQLKELKNENNLIRMTNDFQRTVLQDLQRDKNNEEILKSIIQKQQINYNQLENQLKLGMSEQNHYKNQIEQLQHELSLIRDAKHSFVCSNVELSPAFDTYQDECNKENNDNNTIVNGSHNNNIFQTHQTQVNEFTDCSFQEKKITQQQQHLKTSNYNIKQFMELDGEEQLGQLSKNNGEFQNNIQSIKMLGQIYNLFKNNTHQQQKNGGLQQQIKADKQQINFLAQAQHMLMQKIR